MGEPIQIADADLLLVIDVQRDFCAGGALEVTDGDAVVGPINRLAAAFRNVAITQDWHPAGHQSFAASHPGRVPYDTVPMPYGPQTLWPAHCVQGTRGAEFHPDLQIPHAQLILRKGFHRQIDSYSAFFENDHTTATGLVGWCRDRGFQRIFIAGLALDFCVRFSAVDGLRAGFPTIVVQDLCRAVSLPGSVEATRAEFEKTGVISVNLSDFVAFHR